MAHASLCRLPLALLTLVSNVTPLWAQGSRSLPDASWSRQPEFGPRTVSVGAQLTSTLSKTTSTTAGRSLAGDDRSSATYPQDAMTSSDQDATLNSASCDADLDRGREGPWSRHWTNSIAICACMKSENSTDITEWLEHYRWLGVDRILLTENEDPPPPREALQPYIESGFLEYSIDGTPHAQLRAYARCHEEHGSEYNWMAFIDLDEFLIIRDPEQTLKGLLDEYKLFPGLVVYWIMFGASGRDTRPADGGILKVYTHCQRDPNPFFKTIANMFYTRPGSRTVHGMLYMGHAHPVNEARYPVPHSIGEFGQKCGQDVTCDCPLVPEQRHRPATVERFALFHYATKSREDFAIKEARGFGNTAKKRAKGFFEKLDSEASDQGGICDEGVRAADMRLAAAERQSAI